MDMSLRTCPLKKLFDTMAVSFVMASEVVALVPYIVDGRLEQTKTIAC